MKIKPISLLIFTLVIFVFFIFYKSLDKTNIYSPSVNLNKLIPEFDSKTFYTNTNFSNNDLKKNNYYLINIWASWCAPCQIEHKFLLKLNKIEKLNLIGINYKDLKPNAESFLKDLGNPYDTILIDKEGKLSISWGAYGVPETFLVFNNKIKKKYTGPLDETSFNEIKKILNQ